VSIPRKFRVDSRVIVTRRLTPTGSLDDVLQGFAPDADQLRPRFTQFPKRVLTEPDAPPGGSAVFENPQKPPLAAFAGFQILRTMHPESRGRTAEVAPLADSIKCGG
jgi:hypothetical protein